MDEKQAKALAEAIGGEDWQSGGGVYVVAIRKPDGSVVVFSDDLVCEYESDEAFEAGQPKATIELREDPEEYWVVYDEEGTVFLNTHGRGWADEYEAQQEASGLQSRTGVNHHVRRQRLDDALKA